MWEERCIQGFGRKPEEKRQPGRPRRRCEDNIGYIFRRWDVEAWTVSIWLRWRGLVNEVMKLWVP